MLTPGLDLLQLGLERQRERLAEAERLRLVRLASAQHSQRPRLAGLMAALGRRLAVFGSGLEKRYSVKTHQGAALDRW